MQSSNKGWGRLFFVFCLLFKRQACSQIDFQVVFDRKAFCRTRVWTSSGVGFGVIGRMGVGGGVIACFLKGHKFVLSRKKERGKRGK